MSACSTLPVAILLAGVFAVAPLAAQQDTTMMQHDSTMMDHGHMMDSSSMSHDKMAGHDSAMGMGANMMFMGAEGEKAAGDYEVSEAGGKPKLKLTDDFAVAEGPDLYLVLANGDTPDKGALYLGKLKQVKGAQAYDLPKGKDLSKYTKLLVWSKKEKRAVASAEWHPTVGGAMNHM